jgi:hypothetical protein
MSREDGMDGHGIDWIYQCHQVGFWIKSWANHGWFVSRPNHKSDSTRPTWARWQPQNHWLSPTGHVKRRWYGWAWNWLALWMSSGRILHQKLSKSRLIFGTPQPQIWLSSTHMGQIHWLSPSGHVKRWRYGWAWNWLDLWMSSGRILGQKLGKSRLICVTPPSQIWFSTIREGRLLFHIRHDMRSQVYWIPT